MAKKNKYGLDRNIPSGIKREIRQRCGFGCVVCGLGIFDYEHYDPEFAKARTHNPAGMTLLCMQCNQKKRRGLLSVETVKACDASPKAFEVGFACEWLDVSTANVEVTFAGSTFINCKHIVAIHDVPVLSVNPPEADGTPYRITGRFCNDRGAVVFRIDENHWKVCQESWDVEWEGAKVTVRNGLGDIALILKSVPPGKIIVERINMTTNGWTLVGDDKTLTVIDSAGCRTKVRQGTFHTCFVGLSLR